MSDDTQEVWEQILEGLRDCVQILYINMSKYDIDLDELIEWGDWTFYWDIYKTNDLDHAIRVNKEINAEVIVILEGTKETAQVIANAFPETPIIIANRGGFRSFPRGWPAQVVVASYAAPRPTEFANAISDALESTQFIYESKNKNSNIILSNELYSELIQKIKEHPEYRFSIPPIVFEELIADIMIRLGYKTYITPRSGDKGRDIIATLDTPLSPMLILVECKRYAKNRLVGFEPISRLLVRSRDIDRANLAMVVTTSGFQKIAVEESKHFQYQLSLKDGKDFMNWIKNIKL